MPTAVSCCTVPSGGSTIDGAGGAVFIVIHNVGENFLNVVVALPGSTPVTSK